MIHKIILGLLAALLIGSALWGNQLHQSVKSSSLGNRLDRIVSVSSEPVQDCAQIAAQRPHVILALGQSNAGNHGEAVNTTAAPVMLFAEGKCILAVDPLPGSTGNGGSIWFRLPSYLLAPDQQRPVVLSVMGVDATSIAEWTDDHSLLRQRLTDRVKSMKALGLMPRVIFWQQGEADSQLGTASKAITDKAAQKSRFKVGPDTDTLNDASSRIDGCHFSALGLDQAARLWASKLRVVFASI